MLTVAFAALRCQTTAVVPATIVAITSTAVSVTRYERPKPVSRPDRSGASMYRVVSHASSSDTARIAVPSYQLTSSWKRHAR
ncbi:Uncharacterised protein [Mycobacteroides abscessus subsp. abscessus]|nr:Uncharacterised protein [Mycobacteroides abscessus subsp. abscessus]